jgi:TonB family protein
VFARIARAQPALAATIETAPDVSGDATVLTGILQGALRARRTLPTALIDAGLRHGFPVRVETLEYVAAMYGNPKAARAALGRVTLPAPAAGAPGDEERWMRALEQRWLTGKNPGHLAALIATLPDAAWIRQTGRWVLDVLSADERTAFAKRFALPDSLARALREVKLDGPIYPTGPTPVPAMTLLSGLPAVMLADVIRQTGCAPGKGDEQFASLRYRIDGRPAAVGLVHDSWSPGCERAAHAAVAMSYGTPPLVVTDQTNALVRLDQEFVACLATRRTHADGRFDPRPLTDVLPPTKLRNVNPVYPAEALNARVQGVVIIEAQIEPSGCIGEARVVRPVRPSLDAAAMQAVTRWQYTPTLLNGSPVRVSLTSTVNFALH